MFHMRDFVEGVAEERMADTAGRAEVRRLLAASDGVAGSRSRRGVTTVLTRLTLRRGTSTALEALSCGAVTAGAAVVVVERRLEDRRCSPPTSGRGTWGAERRCVPDRRAPHLVTPPPTHAPGAATRPVAGAARRRRRRRDRLTPL